MANSVNLVVKETFEAFGKTHTKDEAFDLADARSWPKGTLQRRIQNGFLGYDEEDLLEEEDVVEDPDDQNKVAAPPSSPGRGGRSFRLPGQAGDDTGDKDKDEDKDKE